MVKVNVEVAEVPVDRIDVHPANVRQPSAKDPLIVELAESIRAQGVLQPVMVRPKGDRFELAFGARRLTAARVAGLESIPATVRTDLDDEAFEAAIVVENLQRADLHPLEEARQLHKLIRAGQDIPTIAAGIGRSPQYVMARAQLTQLTKGWKKLCGPGGELADLPAGRMELIARHAAAAQDALLKELGGGAGYGRLQAEELRGMSLKELEGELLERTTCHLPGPWDPDDDTLVPKAGACTSCPHRASAAPDLFGDVEDLPKGKTDTCTNAPCWREKRVAFIRRAQSEASEKLGGLPVLVLDKDLDRDDEKALEKAGVPVVREWGVSSAKKSDPDAVPTVNPATGRLCWRKAQPYTQNEALKKARDAHKAARKAEAKEAGKGDGAGAAAAPAGPATPLGDRIWQRVCQRYVIVIDQVREALKAQLTPERLPGWDTLEGRSIWLAVFGLSWNRHGQHGGDWDELDKAVLSYGRPIEVAFSAAFLGNDHYNPDKMTEFPRNDDGEVMLPVEEILLEDLRHTLQRRLELNGGRAVDCIFHLRDAYRIGALWDFPWADVYAIACDKVVFPKSWAKQAPADVIEALEWACEDFATALAEGKPQDEAENHGEGRLTAAKVKQDLWPAWARR